MNEIVSWGTPTDDGIGEAANMVFGNGPFNTERIIIDEGRLVVFSADDVEYIGDL